MYFAWNIQSSVHACVCICEWGNVRVCIFLMCKSFVYVCFCVCMCVWGGQGRRNDFKSVWARPEKADERGGGLRHICFFSNFKFFQHLYLIQVGGSPPTCPTSVVTSQKKKKKKKERKKWVGQAHTFEKVGGPLAHMVPPPVGGGGGATISVNSYVFVSWAYVLVRSTLWEYLNNSTQWWHLFHQHCGGTFITERTKEYPHNVVIAASLCVVVYMYWST